MSEMENVQMNKMREIERLRNAERLGKALRPYLQPSSNEETQKTRGRVKDKRICQLNAAYKYVLLLEKSLKELCEKTNEPLSDECRLLHIFLAQKEFDLSVDSPLGIKQILFFKHFKNQNYFYLRKKKCKKT